MNQGVILQLNGDQERFVVKLLTIYYDEIRIYINLCSLKDYFSTINSFKNHK